ncbi:xaa-Pro aminopeptidase 1-like [Crassostrea virginica]
MWTDGRYFLQAEAEMDCNWILMKKGEEGVPSSTEWMISVLEGTQDAKVGAYPFLLGSSSWDYYEENLSKEHINITKTSEDLIGNIWTTGRPAVPNSPINALPNQFSGKHWQRKMADMHEAMAEKNVDVMVVTGLDETAWLLNARAEDILYTPVFLSYIIVDRKMNNTILYIKDHVTKLTSEPTDKATTLKLFEHLNTGRSGSCVGKTGYCVEVLEYEPDAVTRKMESLVGRSTKVWISPFCNYALYSLIPEDKRVQENTPACVQKARKNPIEKRGMINSHVRDAVALITFMAKLEKEVKEGKHWTELSAAEDLAKHRGDQKYNRGLSFETISSSGSNGAVIHYAPSNLTDKAITTREMYLLDSGGQYLDGTTDVTRTFHFGSRTDFEKECYTLVLKGYIDLASVRFLKTSFGPYGRELDILARRPLWNSGLNYRHGTGHGIGMYLGVHEGPARIGMTGKQPSYDHPIEEGQFFSDEPGYYEDGQFGVRIESIMMAKKMDLKYKFPNSEFLGFETITLVPLEPNLIKYEMLSKDQIDWLNEYHKKIQDTIGPLLINTDKVAYDWLTRRTGGITHSVNVAVKNMAPFNHIVILLTLTLLCVVGNFEDIFL